VTTLLECIDLSTKFELVYLPQPLYTVQCITARYICNFCLLFAYWFPVLHYNVNDSQSIFYQNGPASPRKQEKS